MKNISYLFIILFAIILSSCEYNDSPFRYNMGNNFVEDNARVIMIDSLTIKTYTTAVDSLTSSQSDRFMTGRYENKFGIITTCESYFRLDPSGSQYLHESSVYDSACFIINLDGYSFGDTTKICKLQLFRLTEDITVDSESEYVYNKKQFAHEAAPLASFSVDLTDDDLDSVFVRLPESFGEGLFNLAYNEDPENVESILDNADIFKKEYKGFVIKPEDGNISCVIGINADADSTSAPKMRIFYHDYSLDDNLYFDFEIEKYETYTTNGTSTTSSYVNYYSSNYINNDYSNFFVNNFPANKEKTPGTSTGNVTILQGGMNLRTRIEIPYIDNLYYLGIGSVIKAELIFEPVTGTYNNKSDLPSSLEIYVTDPKNRNYGQLYEVGTDKAVYSVLHYNEEFKNEIYYSFDITQYLVDEYIAKSDPLYSLLLALPQSTIKYNVDQLIIGDQDHPVNKMRLKVYLATYN